MGDDNGWLLLGFEPVTTFTDTTGTEFHLTCISDPDLCDDGLTVGLWIKLGKKDLLDICLAP